MRFAALNPQFWAPRGDVTDVQFDCPLHPGHRIGIQIHSHAPDEARGIWTGWCLPTVEECNWERFGVRPSIGEPPHGIGGKHFKCSGHFTISDGEISWGS